MEIFVKIISAPRRRYIACKVGYGGVPEIFLPPGKGVADAELLKSLKFSTESLIITLSLIKNTNKVDNAPVTAPISILYFGVFMCKNFISVYSIM